ncbi:MAG: energy transducer TonB [Thermoanaerobaculia bacterium]
MFETTVVPSDRPELRPRRILLMPVSIGAHVLVITFAVVASIWTVGFPQDAPAQVRVFTPFVAPRVPPAPRPRAVATPSRVAHPPARHVDISTPESVPDTIPQLQPPAGGAENADSVDSGEESPFESLIGTGPDGPPAENLLPPDDSVPRPVGAGVKAPVRIAGEPPLYPHIARVAGISGAVVLRCVIDERGHVNSIEVVSTPSPMLSSAAVDAVRGWRFRPGVFRGHAVATIFELTVNFRLER